MIKVAFKKSLSWKNLIIIGFLLVILYLSFFFLNISNLNVPQEAKSWDVYINGYGTLPMIFTFEPLLLNAVINEIIYFILLLLPIASVIKYYLEEAVTTAVMRIGRKKTFVHLLFVSIFYTVFATGLYVLCQYLYYGDIWQYISVGCLFIPVVIKILVGIMVCCIYLYLIIQFDQGILAIGGSFSIGILAHLLLRLLVVNSGYTYQSSLILLVLIVLLIVLMSVIGIRKILTKDL